MRARSRKTHDEKQAIISGIGLVTYMLVGTALGGGGLALVASGGAWWQYVVGGGSFAASIFMFYWISNTD